MSLLKLTVAQICRRYSYILTPPGRCANSTEPCKLGKNFHTVHNGKRNGRSTDLPVCTNNLHSVDSRHVHIISHQTIPGIQFSPSIQCQERKIVQYLQHQTKFISGYPDAYQQEMGSIRNTLQSNNHFAGIMSASTTRDRRVKDKNKKIQTLGLRLQNYTT